MPQAPPFGIVGLGTIGGGLARQALDRGITVVGHDQNPPREDLRDAGLEFVDEPEGFRDRLSPPRRIFMYVPAGDIVDTVLDQLTDALEDGDVIVDGGNSYWGDSIRRQRRLSAEHDLHYVDMGTSGGSPGAEEGACFMAGGTDEAFDLVEPILDALSVEGGYVHCGPPGAGHFVKLVHNGIEFGMLQAIG
ncbi:MAG: NAD(P)-binding domain-containing protein [Bradymonadaceae bacterium]